MSPVHFDFAEPTGRGARIGRRLLRLLGVRPGTSGVSLTEDGLVVVFGPWRVRTTVDNVAGAEVSGPYPAWRALGVRLSLADRGLTFGTVTTAGVCIRFREAVAGIEPFGLLHHPAVTVTVAQPQELARRLDAAGAVD